MKRLKKHAIGYNTVSSVDRVVSTRGVKSKPKNLEIYGYTHEIGEGEKSPDNPYKFVNLDSGNMNLCRDWNFISDLFTVYGNKLTLTVTENTTRYQISSKMQFSYDKGKIYIYLNYQGAFTAGASAPIFRVRFLNANGYDATSGSGNISNYTFNTVRALSSGTYTLASLLSSLAANCHYHSVTKNMWNCNCDCNCDCGDDNCGGW